ncbi:hypothetical protein HMPREF9073_02255 [Capnocytophaga sp. oral taxon 326 str. F0382]|nr:hypothetical protein HMPREF9073_02255 [Capnocytophaga sp. oral taxon 326 str. F0382]
MFVILSYWAQKYKIITNDERRTTKKCFSFYFSFFSSSTLPHFLNIFCINPLKVLKSKVRNNYE